MARKVSVVLSHWYQLIEGLQESPQRFYGALEHAIRSRQLPKIDRTRINYKEGGLLSAKREYFRVRRKEHLFDVCAAPFGNGFFVSWWLGISPGFFWRLILSIPVMGPICLRFFKPPTYYQLDTALMFQESIRQSVLEVVDQISKTQGLRLLSEAERKPILSNLFQAGR